ncbi:MAG: hypothetical protein J5I65_17435, partial [Aridibacter famidurans]|nr:hypothetical protein [Aridibacter famidurans]
ITLASPKPQILRPVLINETLRFDNLRLQPMFEKALREASFVSTRGGEEPKIVFIDADEMSQAVRPSGSYKVVNDVLTVSLVLVRDNKLVGEEIVIGGNASDPERLVRSLVEKIQEASTAFNE